jgi:hypothetical protein
MRATYGRQTVCETCGSDVEYHGREHGWIDRGGNSYCDTSGAARWDQDGVPVPYPHKRHKGAL